MKMISISGLQMALIEKQKRGAASFLHDASITIKGKDVTIDLANFFFKDQLDADKNRKAISDILEKYISDHKLILTCK